MEIKQCAKDQGYPIKAGMRYGCVYNGCDFKKPEEGSMNASEVALLATLQNRKFVFGVGTFEPRKGYGEAIKAFEVLWKQHDDLCYVIAGRKGVSTGSFVDDCMKHPEYGRHLFLAVGASDLLLSKLYEKCLFVLNCSHAEGFGIPLMEATFYRKPILARRLPVFEEIMKDQMRYFDDDSAKNLSFALDNTKNDIENDLLQSADIHQIPCYSWDEVGKICESYLQS